MGLIGFAFVWVWALGTVVAGVLAVASVLTCPWPATAKAALWCGCGSIVAATSAVPPNVYACVYWSQPPANERAGTWNAGGIVRDATFHLEVAGGYFLIGGARVVIGRHRARVAVLRGGGGANA